jgi:ferritin
MMIKNSIEKAINDQINAELYSAYLYLSMSAYFEGRNMPGFAHWMSVQAKEEVAHAMKFYNYTFERGGNVKLASIEAPPAKWKSPLEAFESAYKHELKVTGLIHKLVDLARSEKDVATENFLMWYVDEQVEEEAHSDAIVQKLKLIKDSANGLFMLDKELSGRE